MSALEMVYRDTFVGLAVPGSSSWKELLLTFKELAKRSAMSNSAASAKRSKSTSGDIGVSPDTMRLRPRSKIPRKRLDFQCKCIYNQYI